MSNKKKSKLQIAMNEAQEAVNRTNEKINEIGIHANVLSATLNRAQEYFDELRNVPNEQKIILEEARELQLQWKEQVEFIEENYKKNMGKTAGGGTAGAGVGVAVASLGPSAAMGIATTFGVASTGTAISTLSGAAATNAALAWLGGGALAAGGGGMAAGSAFLALAGPLGLGLAGISLLTSSFIYWKNHNDKKILDDIFIRIYHRDTNKYDLATTELNERISRVIKENSLIEKILGRLSTYGTDYLSMSEDQQYELGSLVNQVLSSTQLLVKPIEGLQPYYSDEDLTIFYEYKYKNNIPTLFKKNKTAIVYLANLISKIQISDQEQIILGKSIRRNKKLLQTLNTEKKYFNEGYVKFSDLALRFKYGKSSGEGDYSN